MRTSIAAIRFADSRLATIAIVAVLTAAPLLAAPTQPVRGETDYAAAVEAAAAKDCPTALDRFEAALARRRRQPPLRQRLPPRRHRLRRLRSRHRLLRASSSPNTRARPTRCSNYGFAYVDKIPAAGAITQVILANSALDSLQQVARRRAELDWPLHSRQQLPALADGFSAGPRSASPTSRRQSRAATPKATSRYHVRAWIALGDGYWKHDQLDKARATWQEGLRRFPGEERLEARLAREGEELAKLIEASMDPAKRVDTDLAVLWAPQ